MRKKDQTLRRSQLIDAARHVLLQRGAVGLRVKDIAAEANLAPSSVLYYYPDVSDLLLEVGRAAMTRYAEGRAEAIRAETGALAKLRLAVHLGVPTGPDDEESRLLYEIDALTGTSRAFDVLSAAFFDRQVQLYETVIETGAAAGELEPARPPLTIARGIVAMEDGLGLQVVLGGGGITPQVAEEILLAHAGAMVGADLAALRVGG
jgi:AcrR family transcriptional regulator